MANSDLLRELAWTVGGLAAGLLLDWWLGKQIHKQKKKREATATETPNWADGSQANAQAGRFRFALMLVRVGEVTRLARYARAARLTAALTTTLAGSYYADEATSGFPWDTCLTEGAEFGSWNAVFTGYGCISVAKAANAPIFHLAPRVALDANTTHAALIAGPVHGTKFNCSCLMETDKQLRPGTPNAWEVAWFAWNYVDKDHYYYFSIKPIGWEVGLRDPIYRTATNDGQKVLLTGQKWAPPCMKIGKKYLVRALRQGNVVSISVDGKKVIDVPMPSNPDRNGRIALYCEDADVKFTNLTLNGKLLQISDDS